MLGFDNPLHIAFVLILLLLVFGAKRLPEMGKSLGSGLRGFKESLSGETALAGNDLAPAPADPAAPALAPALNEAPRAAVSQPLLCAAAEERAGDMAASRR